MHAQDRGSLWSEKNSMRLCGQDGHPPRISPTPEQRGRSGCEQGPSIPTRIKVPYTTSTRSRYPPKAVSPDGSNRMTNPNTINNARPTPRSITALVTALRQLLPSRTSSQARTPRPPRLAGPERRTPRQRSRHHVGTGYVLIARCEYIHDVAPAQPQQRNLQHRHQDRERGPAPVEQRNRGQNLTPVDLPRDIPKAAAGHEQLGCMIAAF